MQERGKETSMNIKNIFTLIELNVLFFDGHKVFTTLFSTALGKRRFLRAGNKYFSKVAV